MIRKSDITVFVPVHNESERIADVLQGILHAAGNRICCLVVADDGSTDGSHVIAQKHTDHVVRLAKNAGNGAATRAALRYIKERCAPCDAVVRIDGDGQHDPGLLPEVIDALDRGTDVVVCSRFHEASDTSHALLDRKYLNAAMACMVSKATGWPVTDARSGFLGFRWEKLLPVIPDLRTERYGIPIELLLRVWHANPGCSFLDIPHPAMYHRGISQRLDRKYETETKDEKIERLKNAYAVFLETLETLHAPAERVRSAAA